MPGALHSRGKKAVPFRLRSLFQTKSLDFFQMALLSFHPSTPHTYPEFFYFITEISQLLTHYTSNSLGCFLFLPFFSFLGQLLTSLRSFVFALWSPLFDLLNVTIS